MIRSWSQYDIPIIYDLGAKYDSKFSNHYNLEDYLNNPIYMVNVYETNHQVVGFIIITKIIDTVEILLLYVDENYRHQKIGTKLLESIELNDYTRIILEVSKDNLAAKALYDKQGYKIISQREKYYHGVDALVMEKVIK